MTDSESLSPASQWCFFANFHISLTVQALFRFIHLLKVTWSLNGLRGVVLGQSSWRIWKARTWLSFRPSGLFVFGVSDIYGPRIGTSCTGNKSLNHHWPLCYFRFGLCAILRTQKSKKKTKTEIKTKMHTKTLYFAYTCGCPRATDCYNFRQGPIYYRVNQSCKILYSSVQGFSELERVKVGAYRGKPQWPYHCSAHTW